MGFKPIAPERLRPWRFCLDRPCFNPESGEKLREIHQPTNAGHPRGSPLVFKNSKFNATEISSRC